MVVGTPISNEARGHIFDMHVRRGIPSDEIFDFLFRGTLLNKKYLRHICQKLHSPTFAMQYLLGPHMAPGRPRLLSRQENVIVGMLARKLKVFRTIRFREKYLTDYYGPVRGANIGPSESTMLRVLHRHGFTRKVKETRHILCNPQEGVQFLQRISHLNPVHCIDVDETACSRDSFLEKYGWAPEGERCVYQQIVINNRSFSVIAAVTPIGFLCWEVFEGGVGHEQFVHFMENRLLPMVTGQQYCVIDNAATHKHHDSRIALANVFGGRYYFSARYSPHLKPIETCFSMIKNYVRQFELQAQIDPVRFLQSAFQLYSITGAKGIKCRGHFNGYFRNYENFGL